MTENERMILYEVFKQLLDCNKGLDRIADSYERSDPVIQGVINYVLVHLCEYSLPTLMAIAERGTDEGVEDDNPMVNPALVTGTAKPGFEERVAITSNRMAE